MNRLRELTSIPTDITQSTEGLTDENIEEMVNPSYLFVSGDTHHLLPSATGSSRSESLHSRLYASSYGLVLLPTRIA